MNDTNIITFGKHEGCHVSSIETNYLLWLASQRFVVTKYPLLLDALVQEISYRLLKGVLLRDLYAKNNS